MRTFLREAECVLCGIFGRPRNEKTEQQKLSENRGERIFERRGGGGRQPIDIKKKKRE